MENLIYTCLFTLMAVSLYIGGIGIYENYSAGVKKVLLNWKTLQAIIVFTLNEGLRWGRGVDYNAYYYVYTSIVKFNDDMGNSFEPGFFYLVRFFGQFGFDWQAFVAFMSFFFILSVVFFSSSFKEKSIFILLCFSTEVLEPENLMRWFLAFSFILFATYFLVENKLKAFFAISFTAAFFHAAIILIPFVLYIIYIYSRRKKALLNPIIAIASFFILTYLLDSHWFLNFANIFNMLASYSSRFSGYAGDMHYLAGGYGEEYQNLSLSYCLYYSFLVYYGNKIICWEDNKYCFVYNTFLCGYILLPAFRPIELLFRYDRLLLFFQIVIAGYIFYYLFKLKRKKIVNMVLAIAMIIAIVRIEVYSRYIAEKEKTLYIWDSKGAKTLNEVRKIY